MRSFILIVAALAALSLAAAAEPVEAARQINGPAWFVCDKYAATISISPPRVWASHRTEQVLWINQIERWNSTSQRWYNYTARPFQTWNSFNYYGQGVSRTSWTGGRYHNNTLNLRVSHSGYYRVAAVVNGNQGGVTWSAYIGGRGNHCFVR